MYVLNYIYSTNVQCPLVNLSTLTLTYLQLDNSFIYSYTFLYVRSNQAYTSHIFVIYSSVDLFVLLAILFGV